jgi:phosphoenolpyruvate synthase/pyruvate phosphate dikinase
MNSYILTFDEIDRTHTAAVGGKGANLGELSRIDGIRVPTGFCVTTDAYQRIATESPLFQDLLERLSRLSLDDQELIGTWSAEIRDTLERVAIPDDVTAAVRQPLADRGEEAAYAIRSSATAEDLPTASFAGQQDSFLNVVGIPAILEHLRRCWASLFSERAVIYRMRNGIDHRRVKMAVVVQEMVFPHAAGILFTADPLTGNRKVAAVDASVGLGEALVSGRVTADSYRIRGGEIMAREIAVKRLAIHGAPAGGTREEVVGAERAGKPALTDDQVLRLVKIGRRIEAHFGRPQDIEWCLVGDEFAIVQSRPITTLFPIPRTSDGENHVYVSVGHQQMMSDPMKPLGLSFWQLTTPSPMAEAGGRLFVDVSRALASRASRERLLEMFRRSDPLVVDALQSVLDRGDFIRMLPDADSGTAPPATTPADTLAQSAPGNITSEMGLALLDVADSIRPHPEVVALLNRADRDDFLDKLPTVEGGREARDAITGWLDRYGMRGAGEIDLTRPRWSERPLTLVPILLSNVRNFETGAREKRFEEGRREAREKEEELLVRLRGLPDGERKAEEARRMIDRLRTFIGFREYPKYGMISRYFVYKQALLREAGRLRGLQLIADEEDIFYLTIHELRKVVESGEVDRELIRERRDAFASYQALTPPRVLTSDGEMINGSHHRGGDLPAGALLGLPVSAGTIEGRARVILDIARANVEPGDILVTRYTDPSWSALFVGISGLVTEVGGVMTHGAVVAREYGLPAVVGVEHATRLIADGQRIRVHGTEGFVEILT